MEHFIAFTFDTSKESSNKSFDLTAYADGGSTTTRFSIAKFIPYDNIITLTKVEDTLDYIKGTKEISVKATVSGKALDPNNTKLKWS
ncbi:hypothetical protein FACS1894152_2430 [Bacilli bacterium]|nr:hypothetical protein FACS1894152_2430 [Bacilli bacterium]